VALRKPLPPRNRGRDIKIEILNGKGKPAQGAEVEFFIDDANFGGAIVGTRAIAQFHTDQASVTVKIVVKYGRQTSEAVLPPTQDGHVFKFKGVLPLSLLRKPPTARCPDGSSGQPCVDCVIGGETIRICA
jgi:hypothetical protein